MVGVELDLQGSYEVQKVLGLVFLWLGTAWPTPTALAMVHAHLTCDFLEKSVILNSSHNIDQIQKLILIKWLLSPPSYNNSLVPSELHIVPILLDGEVISLFYIMQSENEWIVQLGKGLVSKITLPSYPVNIIMHGSHFKTHFRVPLIENCSDFGTLRMQFS